MAYQQHRWTNPSVIALAQGDDPVTVIQTKARETVVRATENGWEGPPYDPFILAELLGISVLPNDDVADARIVPLSERLRIEFNPKRPHGRIRYSVAHEIAHTLFPDCAESVRNRAPIAYMRTDGWQLELLCNIAAAEFLMPLGYTNLEQERVDIDNLLKLRLAFDVSTEAILLRIAKLTSLPCAVFAAARIAGTSDDHGFRIDYSVPSRSWDLKIPSNLSVRSGTILGDCTAIGFTAKGSERWRSDFPVFDVQCVGIPPFPGDRFPRVAGVLTTENALQPKVLQITYLVGDARKPGGTGKRIIAHIVNDATPNWGGGFALEVAKEWQFVQDDFRAWVEQDRSNLSLGNVHLARVDDDVSIVHMVAQHGYGRSRGRRIRYAALKDALERLREIAYEQSATVHMPRIGTGQAGGHWELVRELIDEGLVRKGIPVSVYTLPDFLPSHVQGMLNLDAFSSRPQLGTS